MLTNETISKLNEMHLGTMASHFAECVRRRGTTARPPKSDTLTVENRHPFRRSDSWKNWRGDRRDVSPHAVCLVYNALALSHGIAFNSDNIGVIDNPVTDGIGQSRII